ncbi:MAG: hypothetical protein EOM76_07780 [Sphingobacteriia bacterium]|nr:hypothetical protein [Sphingobacteriia bacterium]
MRIFIKEIQGILVNDYIDLERQDIGLKSNNNLFVLQLKYDRSFSFKIPATDKNNRIFFNSNRVDFSLQALRGDIPAVMYVADKQIDGFLKILSATQNGYDAAFYYNQIFPFDILQKIATYLNLSDNFIWNAAATVYNGGGVGLPPVSFGLYRYRLAAGAAGVPTYINYLPSVTMKRLLDECAAASGVNYYFDITDPTELAEKQARFNRLMIKLKSAQTKTSIKVAVTQNSNVNDRAALYDITPVPANIYLSNITTTAVVSSGGNMINTTVQAIHVSSACKLTFTSLPANPYGWAVSIRGGGYYPISVGSTLPLLDNSHFFFYDLRNGTLPLTLDAIFAGYGETFGFDFITTENMINYGDVYYLQDNLPDVTYIDLLTTTAYALGLSLSSDIINSRFVLSTFTTNTSDTLTIDSVTVRDERLIEIDDLDVSGVVDFDSSSRVLEHMKLKLIIGSGEGNNISLPFSEERKYRNTEDVEIRDLALNGTVYDIFYSEKDVLCIYNNDTSIYLQRFNFMSSNLPSIIESGIIVSLKIAQSQSKFLELSATTRIIYKNKAFAIVEATNKDNVTSLKMIRLD